MKKCFVLFMLVLFAGGLQSQTTHPSTITFKKSLFASGYYQHGDRLTMTQLNSVLSSAGDDLKADVETAKRNYTLSMVFGFPGGWLIGHPIGKAIGGGEDMDMTMLSAGLLLGGISVFFEIEAKNGYKKLVNQYNERLVKQ